MINRFFIKIKELSSKRMSFLTFWISFSIICSLVFCSLDLSTVPIASFASFVATACYWVIIACANSTILFLISANRWVFSLLFIPYLALGAIHFYYLLSLGSGISPASIEIAMDTDANMWGSVITLRIIIYLLLALFLGAGITFYRFRYVKFEINRHLIFCAVPLALVFVASMSYNRSHMFLKTKYPINIFYAIKEYRANRMEILSVRKAFDDVDVVRNDSISPVVVVVLGESLRADHLGLNGYGRNTTPRLSNEANLFSFRNTYTEATYTSGAIPMLMTRSENIDGEKGYTEPSFITLFKKAGYRAVWVANQASEPSYTYFAHEGDSTIFHNAARPLNDYRAWYDMEMIPSFRDVVSKRNSSLIVIVQPIGSHWWYPSHYEKEFAQFQPEITHKDIDRTGREELINSYDNSVLATDNFLSNIIESLRKKNAIMLYFSDHGESLGEGGMYLHGIDSPPVHRPAILVWYSDKYANAFPGKIMAMRSHGLDTITAGVLFHSVLDAADLKTNVLKYDLSIFH